MADTLSLSRLQNILANYNFRFRRGWGQNFLVDGNILRKIIAAAELSPGDTVVEIGAGAGTLTRGLAEKAGLVIALEIDKRLRPVLQDTLRDFSNVVLVFKDALEVDYDRLVKEVAAARTGSGAVFSCKGIGNIPYSITTPLLLRLLQKGLCFSHFYLMLQREAARRVIAGPSSREYGVLSVFAQRFAVPEILFRVPASVFYPRPEVDSTFMCLHYLRERAIENFDAGLFFNLVQSVFEHRRKTVLNALVFSRFMPAFDRAAWVEVLRGAGIDPDRRGESLTAKEFFLLAKELEKK